MGPLRDISCLNVPERVLIFFLSIYLFWDLGIVFLPACDILWKSLLPHKTRNFAIFVIEGVTHHSYFLVGGHSITTLIRWGGGGGQKMSVFVHTQGIKTVGGVKKWQNSVHVVVEWPLGWRLCDWKHKNPKHTYLNILLWFYFNLKKRGVSISRF